MVSVDRGSGPAAGPDGPPGPIADDLLCADAGGEVALEARTRELERMLLTAPAAIYINDCATRRSVFMNEGATRLLGYGAREMAQVPAGAMMEFIHPADVAIVEDMLARAVAASDGEPVEAEYRFRHKDGRYLWIADRVVPIARDKNGRPARLMGVAIDVTERRTAEAALVRSEARFRAVQETSIDGFMVLESVRSAHGRIADFRFLFVNDAAARIVGRPRDWFAGRLMLEEMPGNREEGLFDVYARVVETGEPWTGEVAYARDGIDVFVRLVVTRVDDGFAVTIADLTERRLAEQRILASERRFRAAIDAVDGILWTNSSEGEMTGDQPGWVALTGQSRDAYHGFGWAAAVHPDDAEATIDAWRAAVARGGPFEFEHRIRRHDGEWRRFAARAVPVRQADGTIVEWVGIHTDLTERLATADALAASEERLRAGLEVGRMVAWDLDLATGLARRSATAKAVLGLETEGRSVLFEIVHPDDRPRVAAAYKATMAGGPPLAIEVRVMHPDGRELWIANQATVVRDAAGHPVRMVGIAQDVTARREAEAALAVREAEARARSDELQAVLDAAPAAIWIAHDAQCRLVTGNRFAADLVGMPAGTNHSMAASDRQFGSRVRQMRDGRALAAHEMPLQRACRGEDDPPQEITFQTADGAEVTLFGVARSLSGGDGRPRGAVYVGVDVTARKAAAAQLRATLAEVEAVLEAVPAAVFIARDPSCERIDTNRYAREMLRLAPGARASKSAPDAAANVGHYDVFSVDGERLRPDQLPNQRAARGETLRDLEVQLRFATGESLWVLTNATPLCGPDGALAGSVSAAVDITARKAAEDALRRLNDTLAQQVATSVREREAALAQMHEMQKLETIGHLTGGIAHDFNNLLTPIVAGLDLLQRRFKDDERAVRLLSGAQQSAERARVLVSRLLAFARRQLLDPRPVDIAALVAGMRDLIDRSLGPQIVVKVDVAAGIPPARVDANQLELALLNLCVNARDSMPGGGELEIAADLADADDVQKAGLSPGRYLRLCVTDSGVGMTPDTLQRAIEPFYTTKGIGKGTGLGLSMVHGLAAQSGGALRLRSAPDKGTTATIWLPATADAVLDAGGTEFEDLPASRPLRILLVDDEELVREAAAEMLDSLGHRVTQTASGPEALDALGTDDAYDLLLTDYLMPGMNGAELIGAARTLRPGLPAALVTGFATLSDTGDAGLPRLHKPFRAADLARLVAETVSVPGVPLPPGRKGSSPRS